jgi:diguanylate cyclase (GGDEF)-like protein
VDRLSHIENKSLLDLASGLPNRAYLEQTLQIKLRAGRMLGIIQITLNQYAQLLSTYGQKTLDQMIDIMSKTLTANCQPLDTAGRYKNDSLIVLVENVDLQQLRQKANTLMRILNRCTCPHDKQEIKLVFTVGTTMAKPGDTLPILTQHMVRSQNCIDNQAA